MLAINKGIAALENRLGCTLPELEQEAGFRLAPLARILDPNSAYRLSCRFRFGIMAH